MSNSNPTSSRPTLKLKIGARKSPITQSSNANKSKPGAHWSDEYKHSIEVELDALSSR